MRGTMILIIKQSSGEVCPTRCVPTKLFTRKHGQNMEIFENGLSQAFSQKLTNLDSDPHRCTILRNEGDLASTSSIDKTNGGPIQPMRSTHTFLIYTFIEGKRQLASLGTLTYDSRPPT